MSLQSLNLSEFSNEEAARNHRSSDLKSRVANTELQLKYLACAHIDLKNELAVLHQMVNTSLHFFLHVHRNSHLRFNDYLMKVC